MMHTIAKKHPRSAEKLLPAVYTGWGFSASARHGVSSRLYLVHGDESGVMKPGSDAPRFIVRLRVGVAMTVLGLAACGMLHRDLPLRLVGMPRTFVARDLAALAEINRLHGRDLDVQSAAFAIYGNG